MYLYEREDTGAIIEVDFETMLSQSGGAIQLEDGVHAKRRVDLEIERDGKVKQRAGETSSVDKPWVSDTLGFGEHQFADFEADRVRHGFTGVEFIRDPVVPQFFRVRISGHAERERYIKHRGTAYEGGLYDKNGINGGGATITQEQLDEARARAIEKYGPPK